MKTIDVDLDDTICDFTGAYNQALSVNPGIKYPQSQYGFFSGLKPIEGALFYISLLQRHFDVHIVTRPSIKNLLCYTEKAAWVKQHFGEDMLNNLHFTCHKHRSDADYLIDDTLWPKFKGEQIQFGKAPFETWRDIIFYLTQKENIKWKSVG